jgi:hypothetical protein
MLLRRRPRRRGCVFPARTVAVGKVMSATVRTDLKEARIARLIYSAIMSLDGYVADADGRFEWAAPDEEVFAFVNDLERPVGTYLYGRRMYGDDALLGDRAYAAWPAARRARFRADLAGSRQGRVFHHAPGAGHRQDPHRAGLRPGPGPEAEGSRRP